MKVILDIKALKALALIMPKNDIRYYLNAICVRATKDVTTLIVTDGHMLGIHPKKQANTVAGEIEFSLPYDIVMQLTKIPAKDVKVMFPDNQMTLSLCDKWAEINIGKDRQIRFNCETPGKYPDHIKVMPSEKLINAALKSPVCPYFNPEYLYRVSRMFEIELKIKGPYSFPQVVHTGLDTSSIFFHHNTSMTVLVMPVQSSLYQVESFKYNELLGVKNGKE